jgi:hypothetical protein
MTSIQNGSCGSSWGSSHADSVASLSYQHKRTLLHGESRATNTKAHTLCFACDFSFFPCSQRNLARDPLASASLTTCGLRFPGKAACGHYGMPRLPQHLQLRSLEPATDVRTPPMPPTTVPSRDFEPRAASHSANTMQNRTEMPIFLNSGFDISPFSQHCCLPWHYTSASLQLLHWVRLTILHSPCWLCKKISLMKRDLFFVVCAKRQMTRE